MVRVISVHHFSKQHIQTIEQPTASCVAPPDRLLLALSSHCVEVRDLSNGAELVFTFPTVDEVEQLEHCMNGNYVVTLEMKSNRQNRLSRYVRVYANWDSVGAIQQSKMTSSGVSLGLSECGMVQPMRARIAGRVTPTMSQSEVGSLEMIELPVKRRPDGIACCQVSGNVLVRSGKSLLVYRFQVKTHEVSKLRFVDFEELSLVLELSFVPVEVAICENYVACRSAACVHLFSVAIAEKEPKRDRRPETPTDGPIDYGKLIGNDDKRDAITVNLPSIVKENSAIHKHCPYTCCDGEMVVNIKSTSPIDNWTQSYEINNLLQLRLKPMLIEGAHRQIAEEFKCLVVKPLYVPGGARRKRGLLQSEHVANLRSVVCFLATQQEGYLYMFDSGGGTGGDSCVTVYPFTAPVYKLVLEDYMLHALTETGLESYTIRIGHRLARNVHKINNIHLACPSAADPVCLVGLRPFLGVEQLLLAENYIILFANSDGSPTHSSSSTSSCSSWTLYNLELPNPLTLFNDFASLAEVHQFTSPQTYCHLISEAHVILRTSLMLTKWGYSRENAVNLIHATRPDDTLGEAAYRKTNTLLGDYYALCEDEPSYTLSLPYYKMSRISPLDVLKRVQTLQADAGSESMAGLLFYLKTVLLQIKTWTEADVLFTLLGEQNFVDTVLDLFNKHEPSTLSTLVLKNNLLREYATDKLINIFVQNDAKTHNDLVALAVLYLQRYLQTEAKGILKTIPDDDLKTILMSNWELLFDTSGNSETPTFSELTSLLIDKRPDMLAELLAHLITETRAVNLEKVLKVFLEFLPSHVHKDSTNGSLVLQALLERYFKNYYSLPENVYKKTNYEPATFEALKILVRTYLSQLQMWQINEQVAIGDDPDYLFSKIRSAYLDQIPPETTQIDPILKKLQALLCSQLVPKQITNEMLAFFKMNAELDGSVSLQSIVMPVRDGTPFLLEKCPQCLLQYGKDRFAKDDEWKQLIVALQQKLATAKAESKNVYLYHMCILKGASSAGFRWDVNRFFFRLDVLTHLATTLPLQRFLMVLPPKSDSGSASDDVDSSIDDNENVEHAVADCPESEDYEPYILICKQTAHANHIKRLITGTGQKLLTTLNL